MTDTPVVLALRRYPVKSMGGETLASVDADKRGLEGDRWFAVEDENGHFASGKNTRRFRRRDAVFEYSAHTRAGRVMVSRADQVWAAGDAELDAELSASLGVPVRVTPESTSPHHDAGQVSLVGSASLQWCRANLSVDADPRRLRANILLDTEEPFVEETWAGRELTIGQARLRMVERIERCRTVDLAQDGLTTTTPLLKALGQHRDLRLGVYAEVVVPGRLAVGDECRVL